uniref:Uncharacterized protein n=1 Tax=Balaenoptera musculus TaxID=9771 RepID=A0A8C0DA94_BALMU
LHLPRCRVPAAWGLGESCPWTRAPPGVSAPQAKHLDTSTSPLIPIWTEPPLASELEFCS